MPEWAWIIRGVITVAMLAAVVWALYRAFSKRTGTSTDSEWEVLFDDEDDK